MIKDKLKSALPEAMKAKDRERTEALRSLIAAVQYEEIQKKIEPLPDDAVMAVLKSELKKRNEELEFARQAKRPEAEKKLLMEISLIEGFLPRQLSVAELETILTGLKAENPGLNMGAAMKLLKEKHAGQYDGKAASEAAKKVLG